MWVIYTSVQLLVCQYQTVALYTSLSRVSLLDVVTIGMVYIRCTCGVHMISTILRFLNYGKGIKGTLWCFTVTQSKSSDEFSRTEQFQMVPLYLFSLNIMDGPQAKPNTCAISTWSELNLPDCTIVIKRYAVAKN